MRCVYKFKLNKVSHQARNMIDVPMPAKIMSVIEQNNDVILYALVDPEYDSTPVDILIVETGPLIYDNIDDYNFIGTVKLNDGMLISHVFYRYIQTDDRGTPELNLEQPIKKRQNMIVV